jgi:Panthothenate kinase
MIDEAKDEAPFRLAKQIIEQSRRVPLAEGPYIVGISGSPGAGKTTLAKAITAELLRHEVAAAYVPMDGFHLADVQLERLGLLSKKGSISTFDAAGYVNLIKRIKHPDGFTVYAPNFERDLEQPIAGAIPVFPDTNVVITEGNYLLCPDEPWVQIRTLASQIWHYQTPTVLRQKRLVARHVESGKSLQEATQWVQNVDELNAQLIEEWAPAASLIIQHQT